MRKINVHELSDEISVFLHNINESDTRNPRRHLAVVNSDNLILIIRG